MEPTPRPGSLEPAVPFASRRAAGRALAARLTSMVGRDAIVLALPRGGVPVGYEVARALRSPLDVFVVRKLGFPTQPELAMGAIASGGVEVLNEDLLRMAPVPRQTIDAIARVERFELERRERAYRGHREPLTLADRVVILVDDGLATGSTMRAAVLATRRLHPKRVIVAVPVGAPQTCHDLATIADDVVCVVMPDSFGAVGAWYVDFSQTSDDEVRQLLASAAVELSAEMSGQG